MTEARTLGDLKAGNYQVLPVREEMRRNLIRKLQEKEDIFPDIIGYQGTVIPQLKNAILSGQDIILLGERGQAKSRIIRNLTSLLDEYVPVLTDAEIPENPFAPVSARGKKVIAEQGDDAQVTWIHRDARYGEKLATPDITIADLIGEVDPIKIAEGRYLADEEALHLGLVPHTNRGIFAINELPDLAERIQVGLLNLLEERDIQIRGHKIRLDLDIMIVATANPEDYTNRGRIITPLKDRYGAQIRTHYPETISDEISILEQERHRPEPGKYREEAPGFMLQIVAEITRQARSSPDINQRSGVSVRATIANYETLLANALRRAIEVGEQDVVPRMSDLPFIMPSLQGKVEFEAMEEGREEKIMTRLFEAAVREVYDRVTRSMDMESIAMQFADGLTVTTGESLPSPEYDDIIDAIDGLGDAVEKLLPGGNAARRASAVEFILEGLHLNQLLNKDRVDGRTTWRG